MKSQQKNKIIADGKSIDDRLQHEVCHISTLSAIQKIDAIRSVERGVVKRELTKEELILKDFILRNAKTLRWARDLLELTLMPC